MKDLHVLQLILDVLTDRFNSVLLFCQPFL